MLCYGIFLKDYIYALRAPPPGAVPGSFSAWRFGGRTQEEEEEEEEEATHDFRSSIFPIAIQ
jgi:hypothetical protein